MGSLASHACRQRSSGPSAPSSLALSSLDCWWPLLFAPQHVAHAIWCGGTGDTLRPRRRQRRRQPEGEDASAHRRLATGRGAARRPAVDSKLHLGRVCAAGESARSAVPGSMPAADSLCNFAALRCKSGRLTASAHCAAGRSTTSARARPPSPSGTAPILSGGNQPRFARSQSHPLPPPFTHTHAPSAPLRPCRREGSTRRRAHRALSCSTLATKALSRSTSTTQARPYHFGHIRPACMLALGIDSAWHDVRRPDVGDRRAGANAALANKIPPSVAAPLRLTLPPRAPAAHCRKDGRAAGLRRAPLRAAFAPGPLREQFTEVLRVSQTAP